MNMEYNKIVANLQGLPLESDDEVEALLGELRIETEDECNKESGRMDSDGIPPHRSPSWLSSVDRMIHKSLPSHTQQSGRKMNQMLSVNAEPLTTPGSILKTTGQPKPNSNLTKFVNQKWYVLTAERCKLCTVSDEECWVFASGKKGACLFCVKRKVKCQYSEKGWIGAPGLQVDSKSSIVPKHVTFIGGGSSESMDVELTRSLALSDVITSGIKEVQQNSKDIKEAGMAFISSLHAYNQKLDELQLVLDKLEDM